MFDVSRLFKRIWGLRNWRHLTSVILRRLGVSTLFKIQVDSISLYFHPAAFCSHLWEDSTSYSPDRQFLKKYLKEGDIVIDAGANIGLLTLLASDIVGNNGLIVSIEAHPQTYRFLLDNINLNNFSNVKPYHFALGAEKGWIQFSNETEDDIRHVLSGESGMRVQLVTLDMLTKDIDKIDLLKIDVEGYEYDVLTGAHRTLYISQCIYFESCDSQLKRYGRTCKDLFDFLSDRGFTLFFPPSDDNKSMIAVPKEYFSSKVENLLAIKNLPYFLQRTGYTLIK